MSGRKVTPVVVLVLMLLCVAVAYFVTVVHRLQQSRDLTAERWRTLAVHLEREYRLVDERWSGATPLDSKVSQSLSQEPSDADSRQRDYHKAVDEFRTAVDLTRQRLLADAIEDLLVQTRSQLAFDVSSSEATRLSLAEYNQSLGKERQILNSLGGRLVRVFLVMPDLADFHVDR